MDSHYWICGFDSVAIYTLSTFDHYKASTNVPCGILMSFSVMLKVNSNEMSNFWLERSKDFMLSSVTRSTGEK